MKQFRPRRTRCFELDDPEKAVQEFTDFCNEFIVLVIYDKADIDENLIRAANRAARPISANLTDDVPQKRVLFINEPTVLEKMKEHIDALLQQKNSNYDGAEAFSMIKGTSKVAFVIPKGFLMPLEMGTAFNRAIIELERLTTS